MSYKHPLFFDYMDRLMALHNQMKETIAGLPPEALVWSPGEEMNSIAVLVTHACGAERFWVESMVGGRDSGRVREEEFTVETASEETLTALLDDTLEACQAVLETLTLAEMLKERFGKAWGRNFRKGWSLLHALDHTATHVGHMQLTRQLWEHTQ